MKKKKKEEEEEDKKKKEKKRKEKKKKEKKRKEKKIARPLFWHFARIFFPKKCASNLLLCASILGVRLDNKVNYFPQGQIFRIYMYIYIASHIKS